MKITFNLILIVLVFFAIASGVAKVMLMQQDVDFFGQYGFSNFILIVFGAVHLLGGVLLAGPNTRVIGAIIVAVVFIIAGFVLVMAGNIPLALITFIFVFLSLFVIKKSLTVNHPAD